MKGWDTYINSIHLWEQKFVHSLADAGAAAPSLEVRLHLLKGHVHLIPMSDSFSLKTLGELQYKDKQRHYVDGDNWRKQP